MNPDQPTETCSRPCGELGFCCLRPAGHPDDCSPLITVTVQLPNLEPEH